MSNRRHPLSARLPALDCPSCGFELRHGLVDELDASTMSELVAQVGSLTSVRGLNIWLCDACGDFRAFSSWSSF